MKLQRVQSAFRDGLGDAFAAWIDKHPDLSHEWRQGADDVGGSSMGQAAGACFIKHKAERVGARIHSGQRVVQIGHPANFDSYIHASGAAQRTRASLPPFTQVVTEHPGTDQTFRIKPPPTRWVDTLSKSRPGDRKSVV